MARAAAGWESSAEIDDDVLLDGMEAIVSRLNHDFEADLGMFDTALEEFGDLKAEYEALQSARVAVLRSEEDEKLEAHVNLDRARLFIKALLQDEVPQEAARFLLERHWYRLMKGIYKSQGESKAWKTSARIARELMWSLQPNVQFTQPKRFQKVVPGMLSGLADGLKALGIDEAEQERLVESIRQLHNVDQQVLNDNVWDAQTKLDAFEKRTREAQAIVDEAPPLPVDEPVVQHKPADLTYYMDRIEELQTDGWFEIDLSVTRTERGCLSHIVGEGSKFVFTNYQGEKIAERSAIGFAMALRNDSIRPLDDAPLFDRMIDTLVSNIGKGTRAAAR